jgi:hypothetical protein
MFLVRVYRFDCYVIVTFLGRCVTRWTKLQDKQLLRLIQYLDATSELVLECFAHAKDFPSISLLAEWDADHAGSIDNAKSTSGYIVEAVSIGIDDSMDKVAMKEMLVGVKPTTRVLLEWCSKLQGATERSTPGAEMIAGADCMTRAAWPLQGTLEQVYNTEIPLILNTDNSTCKLDLEVKWSKGMRHLRKHQRISISLLGEGIERDDTLLLHRNSSDNRADVMTKALPAVTHWKHIVNLGLTMVDPAPRICKARL